MDQKMVEVGPWRDRTLAECRKYVTDAKGGISPRIGHGPHLQRILLEEEGVNFDRAHRLDLSAYGWAPDMEWRDAHGML
jgi:alkylated DNA nucleotide flippase Atl1